jgi:predicted NAD/FAD-dependent oxidoreductase
VDVRGAPVDASTVIAAVPWHDLPALFTGETREIEHVLSAAAGTAPSPIVTVNVWCDRRIFDAPFVGLPGRVMQWVFQKGSRAAEGQRGTGSRLSLVSSGADEVLRQSNEALVDLACRELREAFPPMRDAVVLRASVLREPRATFSIAPGQPRRPGTRTPVRGLYLAGDWIDTGLPATIEGAAASGHLAAEAVMRDATRSPAGGRVAWDRAPR